VKVPLPNLDDRRWADLVDEGRALIPLYAPDWTDHNVHDPGITLMELFAWIAEMDIYQLNRVTDRHKRNFLALVGIAPAPPQPARAVLSFTIAAGGAPLQLPAEVEFAGYDPLGELTVFRTLEALSIAPGRIASVLVKDAQGLRDMTEHWRRGESFPIFGPIPQPGAELYLGFDQAWPTGEPINLFFNFPGKRTGEDERRRIIRELQERRLACRPPFADAPCADEAWPPAAVEPERIPRHHGARLVWEALVSAGTGTAWRELDADEVDDDTRAFTLDGRARITLPVEMVKPPASQGTLSKDFYYLRVRFEAGAYDAPPALRSLALNGVAAEQAISVGEPQMIAGQNVRAVSLDAGNGRPNQEVTLPVAPAQVASFRLFTFEPASNEWRAWQTQPDFDASTRRDTHILLDPTTGTITFSDGEKGQAAPFGAQIYAVYRATRAEAGNLAAHTINRLVDSSRNRAVITDFDGVSARFPVIFKVTDQALASLRAEGVSAATLAKLAGIKDRRIQGEADFLRALKAIIGEEEIARHKTIIFQRARAQCEASQPDCVTVANPLPATGGAPAETLADATGRAVELMGARRRAVTLSDYEELAMQTPGAQLARAKAVANLHPSFPCLKAPGVITLIILPDMPGARPSPSFGLRRAVAAYLRRRRVIGARVEVVAPTYLEVAARARVSALAGVNKINLRERIVAALNEFLDPLRGGPERSGWPFGRDVFRSEILQVIDEVAGVDYVIALALVAAGCEPECGNVCLAPTWLVAAGQHEIEVV
jgi:hypothetical protein